MADPSYNSLRAARDEALRRIRRHHEAFGSSFPTVDEGAGYQLKDNDSWLSGFWTGLLWLAYRSTGDESLRRHAESLLPSFETRLRERVHITHDLGFLFLLSARAQWQLAGDEGARGLALWAADELMRRYRPEGHYIQAWGAIGSPEEGGRFIIDSMMNLPLLFWATDQTGDERYHDIGYRHTQTSLRFLVRPDGSSYHTYLFDPGASRPIGPRTHQGYADDSLWSRGQAWTIYGFAVAAEWCREECFLDASRRAALRFLAELPADGLPWWDLRLPEDAPHYLDSSAAAIAAGGLLRLSRLTGEDETGEFRIAARTLLESLVARCFQTTSESQGLLRHGALHVPRGWAVDSCIIFGDYFFLEALLALEEDAPDFWGPPAATTARPGHRYVGSREVQQDGFAARAIGLRLEEPR